ncbi:hypothetical protein C8Q69DRAFT_510997 [Paecilomyces variotii]|uniref:Uncharacterized protein n=1 Tax=Byssochlamys spectabilis TaxID=264951 RepID=A0A443HHS6_BYSSP|nr:hypothetical protein C8Q69DRAFT_510997 [Paecilomyces variotii]RWQ91365.1 hypothetical protein C8Q69DRAFT_510997 [Paecilomyces variotii]
MNIDGYALVTGAGSGIGKACALAFAKEGAAGVVFVDLNLRFAEEAAAESRELATHPKYKALALSADVTSETQVDSTVAATIQEFGQINYAVNSAGIGVQDPAEIADASVSEFARFLNVNVMGTFLVTRAVSKVMKDQNPTLVNEQNPERGSWRGVIINLASCASFVATPLLTQYTTSKHAVLGLTRNAALDNARYGIRVNCISPSWVGTPMVDRAIEGIPDLERLMADAVPMGRIAHVDEIADIILFLSSPKASYVTGSNWIVDGGTTLTAHVTSQLSKSHGTKMATTAGIDFITDGFPAPGLRPIQRHITGYNKDGKGHFLVTDTGDHHRVMGQNQAVANILYSTFENPVDLNDERDIKYARENEPGLHIHNGTLVRMIDFGPGVESPMHRALSIDYGIVLEGEFELTLDSGESRIMKRGDLSVQRATAHKWKNITGNGTEPGRMMYILLDCKELVVNGEKVEGYLGELEKEYEGRGA